MASNSSRAFEPGDRVRCVRPDEHDGRFTSVGDVLVVLRQSSTSVFWDTLNGLWYVPRFVLVEEPAASSPPWQQDMQAAVPDNIHQPHHYARFVIEPITFINANRLPFNIGNVIKYSCRYDAKNGVEDLLKARRYLDIQIECMSREARVAGGEMARDAWKVAL